MYIKTAIATISKAIMTLDFFEPVDGFEEYPATDQKDEK